MTNKRNNRKKYKFQGIGLDRNEKNKAKKRFKQYLKQHHFESLADLYLLEELVCREIYHNRYKQAIADFQESLHKKQKEKSIRVSYSDIVPNKILDALNTNLDEIYKLQDKLGLYIDKKEDNYDYLQDLKKKFDIWKEENQGSREVTCPFCSKIFFLNIRTDKYKEGKESFFKDRILFNKHLWKLYKENKITKEDIAKILGTPTDYVSWLEKKFTDNNI